MPPILSMLSTDCRLRFDDNIGTEDRCQHDSHILYRTPESSINSSSIHL